ncbi:hypothetical protein QFW80_00900, partial [Luteimonas sp. M1R5S18]|nr:hypothetical protein [Luteimonas rhizosphaericola]
NVAITQMDEGTQQNAALVEEATAAARSMEQQAGQLVQTVAVFRTRDQAATPLLPPAAPPAAPSKVSALPQRSPLRAPARPAPRTPARPAVAVTAAASGEWQEF